MLRGMKTRILCATLLCLSCLAFARQTANTNYAFEVASIKPAAPTPMGNMRIDMRTDQGMLRYVNVSLKDCIRVAYKVKEFQIDGPDWLGNERFDITAKFPEGATEDNVPEMLQALLAERFKLTLHRTPKEHNILALVPGKDGPKLKPAAVQVPDAAPGGGAPARGGAPRPGMIMIEMEPTGAHMKMPAATLSNLADAISRFTERPVVDMSGIEGRYEFDLVFSPETVRGVRMMGGPPPGAGTHPGAAPPEGSAEQGGTIYDAVQQYGLKLEPRKAPLDVLTIDHIEKTPTEN